MKTTAKAMTVKSPEGLKTTTSVREFEVACDEPVESGGTNLGMNPDVRNGFSEIRITPHISCDAPADRAREFVELVASRCPVHDTLSHGTSIVCESIVVE